MAFWQIDKKKKKINWPLRVAEPPHDPWEWFGHPQMAKGDGYDHLPFFFLI
jgi:hypothetical protein